MTGRHCPDLRVSTRGEVLTAGDCLSAYVLERTPHHLDLIAHLPGAAEPPAESLARSRDMLERIAGAAFPASSSDEDALLVGTGRRAPTDAEKAALGGLAGTLPLVLGRPSGGNGTSERTASPPVGGCVGEQRRREA